ncbi:G2/M phase-specific E3 ubiquitin-protein ligase [Sarotherodon galilaeus]
MGTSSVLLNSRRPGTTKLSLEFLMACGNKLVSPKLQDGQELNGMLILKVFKTKALYSESDEDKDPSYISSKSALSSCATDKDSDNDCFEVDSSKIQQDMSSQVTTRLRSHVKCDNPGTSSDEEDDTGTNCIGRSVGKRRRAKQGSDGNSICDEGYMARSDDKPSTSSHSRDFNARSEDIPAMSVNDEDYSSYLTLVASLSGDSSDDEDLNQAIIASLENQM